MQFGGVSRPKAQQQLGLAVINVSRSELRMPSPLWSWGFKRYSPSGGYWGGIDVPLWAPVAVLGVTALWLWYLDRPRPPGACPKCGYDLTGNTTGICPECGKAGPAASGA